MEWHERKSLASWAGYPTGGLETTRSNIPFLWKSYLSRVITWKGTRQWHGGKRAEERKEEGRQYCPIHRRGKRVMVSCCWPTLSDNWFLVCGSAWQDARRQEPSSAGRIPAVSRERRQPGRRVLLDWFYMGPSLGPVHLYPSLELATTTPMMGISLSMCTCSQGMGLGLLLTIIFSNVLICQSYYS